MKRLSILTFICFWALINKNIAQENETPANYCGTKPGKTAWLKAYQKNRQSKVSKPRGNETIYMPMTVTILTNDNGGADYSVSKVMDEICQLNKDFQAANIYFFLNEPIRFIANTKWNNHKTYQEADGLFDNNVENTVNTYYATSAAGNCGYDWTGVGIVLAKGCMGAESHTWAHEMGHELSLPHTFVGWEGNTYSASNVPTEVNGIEVEFADGSNCGSAGDGFCDTPADYLNYRWTCTNGKSISQLNDPKGAKFQVDGTLFMSYSNDACMNRFSNEQMEAMRENCLTQKLEFVYNDLDIKTIDKNVTLIAPIDSAVLKVNKAQLRWSKVKNADYYIYEVARNKNFTYIAYKGVATDTIVNLPDLLYGKEYYWRVKSFNLTNTCSSLASPIAVGYFKAEDAASNVLDVNKLFNLTIAPNPISVSQVLNIKFDSKTDGKMDIVLLDVIGRVVQTTSTTLNIGENALSYELTNIPQGLYLLRMETKLGSVTHKLIVKD